MVSYSVDLQLPEHVWGRCLLRPVLQRLRPVLQRLRPVYKGCALFTRAAPLFPQENIGLQSITRAATA